MGCEVANPSFSANELKTIMTIETIVMVADCLVRKKVESSLRVAKGSDE